MACRQHDATVPGKLANTSVSQPTLSTSSSSALVVGRPCSRPCSTVLRSRGEIAGATRCHRARPRRSDIVQPLCRTQCGEFRSTSRPHERQGLRSLSDQVWPSLVPLWRPRSSARKLRFRRAGQVSPQSGLSQRELRDPCGEPSLMTSSTGWLMSSASPFSRR